MGKSERDRKRKRTQAAPETATSAPAPVQQSLSSLLLATGTKDAELDALFAATPAVQPKRVIRALPSTVRKPEDFLGKRAAKDDPSPPKKRAKKAPEPVVEAEESSEDEADEDEAIDESADEEEAARMIAELEQSDAEVDDEDLEIVHESLLASQEKAKKPEKAKKRAVEDEDPAARDARTLFVGNVPVICASKKASKKALLHHISALLAVDDQTTAHKIESVRFRGIAPAAPVVKGKEKAAPEPEPAALPHGAARAAAHRKRGELLATTAEDEDDDAARTDFKKQVFQTSAQKRKMNAIKGTVHESVDSCIAYVVFDSSAAVDAAVAIPAAALVSAPFEGKVLRFDRVHSQEAKQSTRYEPSREEAKRTAFLGGLDFGQNEQGVREWAEAQIVRERGEPEDVSAWVERVRLVRDRDTGMGKGFAYVLFIVRMATRACSRTQDSECVDELLALEPQHLKLSKRKIRVDRIASQAKLKAQRKVAEKALARKQSSAANALARSAGPSASSSSSKRSGKPTTKPKPLETAEQKSKAEKLSGLDKAGRKAEKAADADRVARRLEKKKQKVVEARKTRKAIARKAKA